MSTCSSYQMLQLSRYIYIYSLFTLKLFHRITDLIIKHLKMTTRLKFHLKARSPTQNLDTMGFLLNLWNIPQSQCLSFILHHNQGNL